MATPDEIRRAREQSSIFSNLFDYVRANEAQLASEGRRPVLGGLLSKEPVMGTDTIRYEGFGPMLAGLIEPLARGVDAPRAAAQGLIPQEDMIGEAFGTAGTAMLGGGAVAKPAGSLGANTMRVYHGGDYRYGDDINAPFFVTPDRKGAEYFAPDDVPFSSVSNFEADFSNALDIDTPSGQARLSEILTKYGIEHDYNPDGVYEKIDIYDVPDDVSYDGTNLLDAAYIPKVQDALKKEGVSALYSSSDALENSSIPAYAVVDPTILGANASKSAGLLSVASDVSARGDQILNMLKSGRGSEVTDAMLDMGDGVKNTQLNQYLAANYDLPMDEASRLARAREMGFDVDNVSYHGTKAANLDRFNPEFIKEGLGGKVIYSTDMPEIASGYAGSDMPYDATPVGSGVLPLLLRGNRKAMPAADLAKGENLYFENVRQNIQNAKDKGFSGMDLQTTDPTGAKVQTTFDASDVRSQFARFDPRLAHLSNLTAANASKPVGILVLEQQARGNEGLGNLFKSQGMNIDDLSAADPMAVQGVLDMAQKRGILDPRSVFSLKRGLLD
jgi:hypothetical protein